MQGVVNGLDLTQVLENLNFLNIDNMWTLINGKLKPLIWRSNVKHKSYLVFSTYIKIMELESYYCIGRELWSVYPTGCHQIWPGGASCQQTGQPRGRIWIDSQAGVDSLPGIDSPTGIDSPLGIYSPKLRFLLEKESIHQNRAEIGQGIGIAILLESELAQP